MLYRDEAKHYRATIFDDVDASGIDKRYGWDTIAVALFGGAVNGIKNTLSDYDGVLLFSDERACREEETLFKFSPPVLVDLECFQYNHLLEQSKEYSAQFRQLPYFGHTVGSDKKDRYPYNMFKFLLSDYIWLQEGLSLPRFVDSVVGSVTPMGVLDCFLSRARGNLLNNLSKNKPLAAKYLTTMYGILIMKWIIERYTVPPASFRILMDIYLKNTLRDEVEAVFSAHSEVTHKFSLEHYHLLPDDMQPFFNRVVQDKAYRSRLPKKPIARVTKNLMLNAYIEHELNEIEIVMRAECGDAPQRFQFDKNSFLGSLLEDIATRRQG